MTDFWLLLNGTVDSAFGEIAIMTLWEIVAVILAIAYLWLAMKASIWCWPAALFSTAIYTVLFWNVSLLMESLLNVYYMVMAIYGFWMWTRGGKQHHGVDIVSWSAKRHALLITVTGIIAVGVGYFMANYTHASFAYLDAATSCFAVMTTYLVAKKVLENWFYWVVIDLISIYLYFSKGLFLTSILFVFYVGMAVAGYFLWRSHMEQQQDNQIAVQD